MKSLTDMLVPGMFAVILGLSGYIATELRAARAEQAEALDRIDGRVTRLNNRVNMLCERIAVVEWQLIMRNGTCASD